ncbi:MAG: TetR family transcriptional regulator [Cyanobacteria bacterium P01_F01_bin.86]
MATLSTRQRLTQAALELFLSQGVGHTTTRQIADRAGVNEVTLFRNFGNKYGLLLAMLQDTPTVLAEPAPLLPSQASEALRTYASDCLHTLEQVASFIRSIIGEADQYPLEHRQALRQRLGEVKQDMAGHLEQLLGEEATRLPTEELTSFLGAVLVGYVVVEDTSGAVLWPNREDFLDTVVQVLLLEGKSPNDDCSPAKSIFVPSDIEPFQVANDFIVDLPLAWVHSMLQNARTLGMQDYAMALVMFGAGLLPEEVARLERSHQTCDKTQHVLRVTIPTGSRQVPVNQWILGKRYGSYTNNPLTKWIKSRKDDVAALFITETNLPMTVSDIQQRWNLWWQGLDVGGMQLLPIQARQTWCVEMLMRGISLENLSILTGCDVADLQLYDQRAREKAAIAAATQLDRKVTSNGE